MPSFGFRNPLITLLCVGLNPVLLVAPRLASAQEYTATPLGSIIPNAINNTGQVAGTDASLIHGVLYFNGANTDLGTLGGYSNAAAINNVDQIVGDSGTSIGVDGFIYQNGIMTDLGISLGGVNCRGGGATYPTAINRIGQIAGYSDDLNSKCRNGSTYYSESHAFLYSSGIMTDLGTLGGTQSYATGINDSGQVIAR